MIAHNEAISYEERRTPVEMTPREARLVEECLRLSGENGASRTELAEAERRRRVAEASLQDIAGGAEFPQCLVAREGEGTLECDVQQPCAACRAGKAVAVLREGLRRHQERYGILGGDMPEGWRRTTCSG